MFAELALRKFLFLLTEMGFSKDEALELVTFQTFFGNPEVYLPIMKGIERIHELFIDDNGQP